MHPSPRWPRPLAVVLLHAVVAGALALLAAPEPVAAQVRPIRSAAATPVRALAAPMRALAAPTGAFFVTTEVKTFSAAAAVDAAGGRHMAFAAFLSYASEPPAYYAYCPPGAAHGCADSADWAAVPLDSRVDEVQLRLTPSGQPRLLIRRLRTGTNWSEYVYAACDAACTDPARWASTVVAQPAGVDVFGNDNPQRYFALDPQERPRIAFFQGGTPDGGGDRLWYLWCDASCLSPAGWGRAEIGLPLSGGRHADLALDARGRPPMPYRIFVPLSTR